jgi:hypothetical protein
MLMNWYVFLGGVLMFLAFILWILWLRRKVFTRERYAFFATTLVFTYSLTVLTHLFSDISLLQILVMIYNNLPVEQIPLSETSWSDKAWSITFLVILSVFVYGMFESWSHEGGVSKLDESMIEVREELGFWKAAFLGMNPAKIELSEGNDNKSVGSKKMNFELCFLDKSRDWPSESRDLLHMYTQHFLITDNEWHKDKECFFSTYIEEPLLVVCSIDMPSDNSILEKINFFSELSKDGKLKVILAVKNSENLEVKKVFCGQAIECYSKKFLLRNLVNFSEYNTYLHQEFYENEVSEGEGVSLKDIYVESRGGLTELNVIENIECVESVEKYLLDWASSKKNEEQIALLGDYGQGKSVLSLKFANELLASDVDRQPIIIELRGKSPRNMPMSELVAAWAYRFNYNVKAILTLLREGRLVVILEGFDELDMVGDKLRRLEHFKKLWEFSRYKNSKVIITGRPNLFLNNDEARNYLQLSNGEKTTFHVKALKLEPFDRQQIDLALRGVSESIRTEILEQYDNCKEGKGFADLIARPSTLFQTSVIWDSIDKTDLNSSKIINNFIEHAYKRQAEKLLSIGGTDLESPVLTAKEREYFMLGIAVGMVSHVGYSNQISGSGLEHLVMRLSLSIPKCCSEDHHTGSLRLHDRLQDDVIESIYNDVRTSGILVRDLASYDSFKFAHKSFLESLFATFIKNKINSDDRGKRLISNAIAEALSISDVFALQFSDEVIGHVTENVVNQGQVFGDSEAQSLMDVLSKKAVLLDKIFFKSKFGVSVWGGVSFLLIATMSYLLVGNAEGSLLKVIGFTNLSSISDVFLSISPVFIALIAWVNVFWVGKITAFRASRKVLSPVKVWLRACEVLEYEVKDERVLSQSFVNRVSALGDSPTLMHDLLFHRIFKSKIIAIEIG